MANGSRSKIPKGVTHVANADQDVSVAKGAGTWDAESIFRQLARESVVDEEAKKVRSQRSDPKKASTIRTAATGKQKFLFTDTNKFVSVIGGRRAGKSYGLLSTDFEYCLANPGITVLYVGLSKPHCKEIYWPIVEELDAKFKLKIEYKIADMKVVFPNGSTITFFGAETRQDVAKLRGRKFHRITIDECQDHGDEILTQLIAVTKPSLADYQGQLRLAGTCGRVLSGIWYEASCQNPPTREGEDGTKFLTNADYEENYVGPRFLWSRHYWTAKDNTAMPHVWGEHLETKALMGWTEDNPTWRREYLAQWVQTHDTLVYALRRAIHTWTGAWPWEDHRKDKCHFVLGADFGFRHGTAIVIWCYVDDEPYIYEFLSCKGVQMSPEQIYNMFLEAERSLPKPVEVRVGDPGYGGLIIMEGYRQQYQLPFEVADKMKKEHFIEAFNASLDANLVRFRPGSPLMDEMEELRWKQQSKSNEHRRVQDEDYSPGDLCDSSLYSFRHARNRFVRVAHVPKEEISESQKLKLDYLARRTRGYWWES